MSESSSINSTNRSSTDPLRIYLVEEIEEEIITSFIDILVAARQMEVPVYIYFNSIGGDTITSLTLYHLVKSIPTETVGINMGKVYSGAMLPYLACDRRITLPHGSFLIHNMKSSFPDYAPVSDFKGYSDFVIQLSNAWQEMLTYLVSDKELIEKYMQQETYLFAQDAKQIGLVHEISEEVI